ncbi:ABC transporter substrate-binding protein [Conexibacter sp. CPCC 206217]|uniref:ABC transporter substrate-binding protein n=1 Tax=Conexibacter sp. CPCC 206217 TaxID=3064574 RepID=UPI00271ADEE7|nr:ABC transporter substrate-binding protein [Conexibacter sp. CPCC 206217]MDO8212618.1 ABC transporter substrate-binding protein [Conexibacter sp. CPCC 206217]
MTPEKGVPDFVSHGHTRRQVVRGTLAGGVVVGLGGLLAACGGDSDSGAATGSSTGATTAAEPGSFRRGGTLRVGATGGGARDTLDAHRTTSDPDMARIWNLYEPLAVRSTSFEELEMLVAESIEPEGKTADTWIVKIRPGILFHDGRPVTADDVIFSIQRILDPRDPKQGAASIGYVDYRRLRKLDDKTVRIPLRQPNAGFPDDIGQPFNGIVPVGYDPRAPIGTGAFRYQSFTPGEQSTFVRNEHYWQEGKPAVDTLVIIDFADDAARVNALLGDQVDAIDNLPAPQIASVRANPKLRVLISRTGAWKPITMRVDAAPFDDVRVRQAFRLIVDREQMVQQVLAGEGEIANDIFGRYDAAYNSSLPQRTQDLEQARALLKQAGREGLSIEFVTAPVFQGAVEQAQVFAQQAKGAGVDVKLRKVDSSTFYGPDYLRWVLAQDSWSTRLYLPQVSQSNLPTSPFNETHWNPPEFVKLIDQARAELDEAKRTEIIHQAQRMQYEQGGEIIPYWSNMIDAHSAAVGGFVEARSGFNLGNFWFKNVGFIR